MEIENQSQQPEQIKQTPKETQMEIEQQITQPETTIREIREETQQLNISITPAITSNHIEVSNTPNDSNTSQNDDNNEINKNNENENLNEIVTPIKSVKTSSQSLSIDLLKTSMKQTTQLNQLNQLNKMNQMNNLNNLNKLNNENNVNNMNEINHVERTSTQIQTDSTSTTSQNSSIVETNTMNVINQNLNNNLNNNSKTTLTENSNENNVTINKQIVSSGIPNCNCHLCQKSKLFEGPNPKIKTTKLCVMILKSLKMLYPELECFSIRLHLNDFIQKHWPMMSKLKTFQSTHWKKSILDALNHCPLIECGKEFHHDRGYYRLKEYVNEKEKEKDKQRKTSKSKMKSKSKGIQQSSTPMCVNSIENEINTLPPDVTNRNNEQLKKQKGNTTKIMSPAPIPSLNAVNIDLMNQNSFTHLSSNLNNLNNTKSHSFNEIMNSSKPPKMPGKEIQKTKPSKVRITKIHEIKGMKDLENFKEYKEIKEPFDQFRSMNSYHHMNQFDRYNQYNHYNQMQRMNHMHPIDSYHSMNHVKLYRQMNERYENQMKGAFYQKRIPNELEEKDYDDEYTISKDLFTCYNDLERQLSLNINSFCQLYKKYLFNGDIERSNCVENILERQNHFCDRFRTFKMFWSASEE